MMDKNIVYSNSINNQELVIHISEDDADTIYIFGRDQGNEYEYGIFFNKAELTNFVKDLQTVLSEIPHA